MAELENELMDESVELEDEQIEEEPNSKKINFIKIGIPVLIIQTIVAYFLANYLTVPWLYGDSAAKASGKVDSVVQSTKNFSKEEQEKPEFGQIYTVEDVIVNPADSQGMQFILINFGFEVKSNSDLELLKKREIQVRDILIKILSSKTLAQLDGPEDKENLRKEVKEAIQKILPEGHLLNVYFSNYIIQ